MISAARRNAMMFALALLALAALGIMPFLGMEPISPADVMNSSSVESTIFWQIRVPRTATAFLAGAVLAISGMVFQALFRNPLATPYTLGVSTGAALGAAIMIMAGGTVSILGISGVSIAAFAGALAAVSFVYALSHLKRSFSAVALLLAGVAANFFFSSMILLVQYMGDLYDTFRILRWLMGGLVVFSFEPVLQLAPFALAGSLVVLGMTHDLNQMASGEELARSRGVKVNLVKNVLFIVTSLMVGAAVAICGPIGFVGMMAPHICRLLVGSDHRFLAPASLLFGGAFLIICDTIARVALAPAELPVGIITACLGGPFFIWLLLRTPGRAL